MANYMGGRIKRIKIANFMTYDHLEIWPKEGLNLIVGLNGSGKSTIMCAICLGLAGKPQFTGRASSLTDFIKHGQKEADIEIELEEIDGPNIVIKRKLKGDKSEWFLNGRSSNQNEISSTVKNYNIDTSNLCQFLPQEKVIEFSRMDKKQRLENMLQAIGEPQLYRLFNKLKSSHKECAEIENSIKKLEAQKISEEEKNDRINDEVNKQENRVRLKNELETLNIKRKLLLYEEFHREIHKLKAEKKKFMNELSSWNQKYKEGKEKQNLLDAECKNYMETLNKLNTKKTKLSKKLNLSTSTTHIISDLDEKIESLKIEFNNKIVEKENQKKRLLDVTRQIEALEMQIAKTPEKERELHEGRLKNEHEYGILTAEIAVLERDLEVLNAEKNRIEHECQTLKFKMREMQDEDNKKLMNLKKIDPQTYDGAYWLQKNQHRFKSNIYLPILKIKVLSKENAKYIENQISFRDMIAFVCENKDDCTLLTSILRHEKHLKVNIVMAPPNTSMSSYSSPRLPDDFKRWGLNCFLIDLINAPDAVLRYLCCCYNIHLIPVSKSVISSDKMPKILEKFPCFYAGNMKITCVRSRYGSRNLSDSRQFISGKNFLTCQKDEHTEQIQNDYKNSEQKLNIQAENIKDKKAQLVERERLLEKCRNDRLKLQRDLKDWKNTINSLKQKRDYRDKMSLAIDEEEEREKLKQKVHEINQEKLLAFEDQIHVFKELINLQRESVKLILCMNSISKEYKIIKADNDEILEKVKVLENKCEELSKEINQKKIPAAKLLEEIKILKAKNGEPLNLDEIRVTLGIDEALTLEEAEMQINHIKAQLNLNEDNQRIIDEFNARKKTIKSAEEKILEQQLELENLKTVQEKMKQQWILPLQHHIDNINKKFSKYFKYLKCAGEISLDIPSNENDFTNYGLQIKLKFHDDEPLTELSQTHHSGGECSVSAIVFILSLQELTEVPFRCIDEINQGMDSVYERKIYHLIADSVSNDRCSQYFLLTPKLLMDLEYPEDAAVHVIYNSPFLNCKLDTRKALQIAKSV